MAEGSAAFVTRGPERVDRDAKVASLRRHAPDIHITVYLILYIIAC